MKIIKQSSQLNFKGQFHCYGKLKPRHSKCLEEILSHQYSGISCKKLLNGMPFNVDVVCLNPSKRAIHPRFNFWITHSKNQATMNGCITLSSKKSLEFNSSKLSEFIKNFKSHLDSLNGNEKLTPKEELERQVDFLLFGRHKSYFN